MEAHPTDSAWPQEIAHLHECLNRERSSQAREAARGALWRLLFEALMRFLRSHARHTRAAERAVFEDIAAEKALELLLRAESGAWDPTARSPSEIAGYLSTTARNGWIDHVQRAGREVQAPASGETASPHDLRAAPPDADHAEGAELARALRECVEHLPERGRRVWFYRAYYEMSSQDIAQHPRVGVKAPHVDVLVQRTRLALRDCLRKKGHGVEDVGRIAFLELWDMLESWAEREAPPLRDALPARRRDT